MEELNHIQDHSLDSSKPDNEYTQGESSGWDFEEDITDILQLDDIVDEGTVIDELSIQSCEGDLVNEISQTVRSLQNKSYKLKDTKINNVMHNASQKTTSLNIKINNKECSEDVISYDPYIIEEDDDLIEVQKDYNNSEEEEKKNAPLISKKNRQRKRQIKEEINSRRVLLVKRDKKYESIETQTVKVNEGRQGIQLMSTEMADEILKALIDKNICEKNDQDTGLRCKECGFFSKNVQERIEHLHSAKHKALKGEVKKAIIYGILENYTVNTFYCTVCSWFITDIESIIEHILSRKHKEAVLISQYNIPGIMLVSFCNSCKSLLKTNEIYYHMFVYNHDCTYYYSNQLNKHVRIKKNKTDVVFCNLCNTNISFDETEKHLKNHDEVCYFFNKGASKCFYESYQHWTHRHKSYYESYLYECNWHHECVLCRGDHTQIECLLKKSKNSKLGVHESEIVSDSVTNFHKEIFKYDTYDSLLPKNADISKVQKNPPTNYYKHNKDESNTSKQISKQNVQDRNSYPGENVRNAYKSYQIINKSRSPSHITNIRDISKSASCTVRYPVKEHPSRMGVTQAVNVKGVNTDSSLISVDVQSFNEDEEFNLITTIVKLLEISSLLGNLGYFFAIPLRKALEKRDSEEDILIILREQANIILMEVISKKLEAYGRVYDMTLFIRIERGKRYLKYLLDISKSSQ